MYSRKKKKQKKWIKFNIKYVQCRIGTYIIMVRGNWTTFFLSYATSNRPILILHSSQSIPVVYGDDTIKIIRGLMIAIKNCFHGKKLSRMVKYKSLRGHHSSYKKRTALEVGCLWKKECVQ